MRNFGRDMSTRKEHETPDFAGRNDPFVLFEEWLRDAEKSEPNDHNAMAVASVDESGMPSVRMVLLKSHDEHGFVFYTNFESRKGKDLLAHPKGACVLSLTDGVIRFFEAALLFHWKSLRRQVRVRGMVEVVTDAEADAYFASRPRLSQVGAWASDQSRAISSRAELEGKVAGWRALVTLVR
jgi:pyridoxamine 5'-phosphate oxidase